MYDLELNMENLAQETPLFLLASSSSPVSCPTEKNQLWSCVTSPCRYNSVEI